MEYSRLGALLKETARRKGVEGAEAISERLWWRERYSASTATIEAYLSGTDRPPPEFMVAFKDAFDLTEPEADGIAWAYTFPP